LSIDASSPLGNRKHHEAIWVEHADDRFAALAVEPAP
jgi:hypothetical protein